MINLNLKYNNDDLKKCKNKLEINRIGNKHCWIKKCFQHWWFFNRGGLLILGDHLFLNYIFLGGQRGLINTAGIINPNLALNIFNNHS